MDFQQAMQALGQGRIRPVYSLYGQEDYLAQEFINQLITVLEGQGNDNLDISRLSLDDLGMLAVLEEANSFSFFSDYRLIILDGCDFVTGRPKNKLSDKDQEALIDYVNYPNEATVLVLRMAVDSLDKRRKISKALQAASTWVDISSLSEDQVRAYVKNYLQYSKLAISRQAVEELLVRVDYQLGLAMTEIQKLAAYNKFGQEIGVEVVRTLVARSLESDVFELTNAVLARDIPRANQIYEDLRLLGNDPVRLHALLVSQFRIMVQAKLLAGQGLQQQAIAKDLGIHPYRVKLALEASRQMPLDQLATFYYQLAEADYQMKTGQGLQDTYFSLLLMSLVD